MDDRYSTQLSEPIFLNELHDRLKQLNPRRVQHAGMYRILGRLVEHDLRCQIAKVESCFHRLDPTFDMVQAPARALLLPAGDQSGSRTVKTDSSSSAPAPSQSGAVIDLTETENAQEDPDLWETDDEVDSDADEIIYGDDRDHLYVYEEPNRFIDLTEASDGDEPHDEDTGRPQTTACDSAPIDLEDEEMPVAGQVESTTVVPTRPSPPPRIILWVDTQLLNAFDYRQWQLYEFFGEVVYQNGHWVLQAQIFRNMEGLDIFAYRQAILMTRALMQGTFQTLDGSTST
ncbi:hypothetical protein BGZ70_009117 [Mortierella alpina]|uniref:Uncharacterized protein n=1 Tax=Mortierella alpina TaxID=64518 RepID=A0A9P6J2G3_MORAP|nr:hypothetical protein BGZ70_009117 [Mortierella alpina]